jgi:hypothetical protein
MKQIMMKIMMKMILILVIMIEMAIPISGYNFIYMPGYTGEQPDFSTSECFEIWEEVNQQKSIYLIVAK